MNNWEALSDQSRVWIYQSNRPFESKEVEEIRVTLDHFIRDWNAHGAQLMAGYELPYDQFIVIFVDQNQASPTGCSIDKSVHLIQDMETKYKVRLTDRMSVAFRAQNDIKRLHINDFWAEMKAGNLSGDTQVFNNLVQNKGEFLTKWEVPVKQSWHKEYFQL